VVKKKQRRKCENCEAHKRAIDAWFNVGIAKVLLLSFPLTLFLFLFFHLRAGPLSYMAVKGRIHWEKTHYTTHTLYSHTHTYIASESISQVEMCFCH